MRFPGATEESTARLTVLLMLASSFPLNSTMEYTAPFTSFSATVCSFPEEGRESGRERELSVNQTVCSAHIQPVKKASVSTDASHLQDHSEVENDVGKVGGSRGGCGNVRHMG